MKKWASAFVIFAVLLSIFVRVATYAQRNPPVFHSDDARSSLVAREAADGAFSSVNDDFSPKNPTGRRAGTSMREIFVWSRSLPDLLLSFSYNLTPSLLESFANHIDSTPSRPPSA